MDESTERKERTAEEWKAFVEEQAGSGKSVTDYCREHGVRPHRLYYWRKRWSGESSRKASGDFIECRLTGSRPGVLVLECPRGYRLQIGRDCDTRLLERTLKVLSRC
jgi:transposase-like protein